MVRVLLILILKVEQYAFGRRSRPELFEKTSCSVRIGNYPVLKTKTSAEKRITMAPLLRELNALYGSTLCWSQRFKNRLGIHSSNG